MKPTYFKVEMPFGIIKDYYDTHFAGNLWIDHGNTANPSIVYIESIAKEVFDDAKISTIFDIAEKLKSIKRDYPDKYQHYLTLYACSHIYNECLKIKNIQDDIEKMRRSNVSHFSEDGKNAEKLGLLSQLNTIRKTFVGMDLWTVNEDFKGVYKEFKYAILEQCVKCCMDVDINHQANSSSSGCATVFLFVLLFIFCIAII